MYKNYTVGIPRFLIYLSLILLYAGPIQADTAPPADAADGPSAKTLSAEELDNLVAPIALYPDALIAQVLPAATLPLEIVEAARYLKEQGGKVTEVPDKGWDQSIIALLEVPPVLEMMNDKLSWTVELGDAVFAQQGDVMDAVQRVRKAAKAAGKLESNEKQVVVVEKEVVTIVQAAPEVIYVPTTYYVPATTTTVVAYSYPDPFVSFTLGLFVGAAISNGHWGYSHMGWGGHNVHRSYSSNRNVNRNVNRNININKGGGGAWKPSTRARTQYNARRNTATRQARGLPAGRGTNRPANRAGTGNVNRPANRAGAGNTNRPANRPAAQRPSNQLGNRSSNQAGNRSSNQFGNRSSNQARPSRQPASRPASRPSTRSSSQYGNRSSSFGGARSSGSNARTNSSRGYSSRGGGGGGGGGFRGGGGGRGGGRR